MLFNSNLKLMYPDTKAETIWAIYITTKLTNTSPPMLLNSIYTPKTEVEWIL